MSSTTIASACLIICQFQLNIAVASLATVRALLIEKREKWFNGPPPPPSPPKKPKPVDPLSIPTADWLKANSETKWYIVTDVILMLLESGLKARKLTFYHAVAPFVFPHSRGDVRSCSLRFHDFRFLMQLCRSTFCVRPAGQTSL